MGAFPPAKKPGPWRYCRHNFSKLTMTHIGFLLDPNKPTEGTKLLWSWLEMYYKGWDGL